MLDKFFIEVTINALADKVWVILTDPSSMADWMGGSAFEIAVEVDWRIGSSLCIRGLHHVKFENCGKVLEYNEPNLLKYTQLSSLSQLPDRPENYSILEFTLISLREQTKLALTIENFPTESIRKHLELYWRTTILVIKQKAEVR